MGENEMAFARELSSYKRNRAAACGPARTNIAYDGEMVKMCRLHHRRGVMAEATRALARVARRRRYESCV